MRGIAAAPNSPLDIMLGLVDPNDPIHSEIASKSNPRQTEILGPLLASLLMGCPPSFCRRQRPKAPASDQAGALASGRRRTRSEAPLPPHPVLKQSNQHGRTAAVGSSAMGVQGSRWSRPVAEGGVGPLASPASARRG